MNWKVLVWMLVFFGLGSFVCADIASDLQAASVSYWKLEESALNYLDETPSNNDFTAGTIPDRVPSIINYGQDFLTGATEYISTATNADFELNQFTICFWLNTNASPDHMSPVANYDEATARGWMYFGGES